MNLSPLARAVLSVTIVVALACYLVIADFGISAGRIHHGVHLDGLDLGGLTEAEAVPRVEALGRRLETAPIVFSTEGFDCRFTPGQLGWGPQPVDTVRAAKEVGRSGGLIAAVGDRLRAWLSGVEVEWDGEPDRMLLAGWVQECAELGADLGIVVDRAALRSRVRRAIETWPRSQVMELPIR